MSTEPMTTQNIELREKYEDFIHTILVDTPDGRERKDVIELDEVPNIINSEALALLERLEGVPMIPLSAVEAEKSRYGKE